MKRTICILLIFLVSISLCGCTPQSTSAAEYSSLLVAAAGFLQRGDEITVLLEALVINSEDSEAENKATLYRGTAKTVKEAIHNAEAAAAQPLHLGHCATIVISKGITAKTFEEICRFCREESELSLSVALVFTENAEKLLSCKSSSTVAMGYEIANMLTEQYSRSGIALKNRFYELEGLRLCDSRVFTLPNFTVNKEACLSDGAMLFSNDAPALYLNPEQTAILALALGRLKNGTVFIENKEFNIKNAKSGFEFKNTDRLHIELTLKISLSSKADPTILKTKISELYSLSKTLGIDIFSVLDTLSKKQPQLFAKYEKDFYSVYKNSELAVVLR